MKPLRLISLISILTLSSLSCEKDNTNPIIEEPTSPTATQYGTLNLMVENAMMDLDGNMTQIKLDNEVYKTMEGDTLSFSTLNYYISNVTLKDTEGNITTVDDSYHLVTVSQMMGMTTFPLTIPTGDYESIQFSIGVDAEANTDETVIKGDLDPNNNMVWNWNIGYKFVYIEGSYKGSTSQDVFSYHIGGDDNYVSFDQELPKTLVIENDKTSMIHMMANIGQFFEGPNTIDVETTNKVAVGPAEEVTKLVGNYSSGVFMVHHIENAE